MEGACLAVCTAVGPNTKISQYIQSKQFPLPENSIVGGDVIVDEADGISLLPTRQQNGDGMV